MASGRDKLESGIPMEVFWINVSLLCITVNIVFHALMIQSVLHRISSKLEEIHREQVHQNPSVHYSEEED